MNLYYDQYIKIYIGYPTKNKHFLLFFKLKEIKLKEISNIYQIK